MRRVFVAVVVSAMVLFGISCTTVRLEYDKMTGTAFPQPTTVDGENVTLGSIYLQGNILLIVDEDDTAIAPLTGPANPADPNQYDYITNAEIETIEAANRGVPVGVTEWSCRWWIFSGTCREYHVWGIVVNHFKEYENGSRDTSLLGEMIDPAERSAFANFYKNTTVNSNNPKYLRSTAHEIGHAFNLNHCDGDGATTIMNQTGVVDDVFVFEFSATELDHLQNHAREAVWPGLSDRDYACPHVH